MSLYERSGNPDARTGYLDRSANDVPLQRSPPRSWKRLVTIGFVFAVFLYFTDRIASGIIINAFS